MSPRKPRNHPLGRPERPVPGVGDPFFEAGALLDELPRVWGLTLWRLLVDVALWARVPPAERPALFQPRADRVAWPSVFGLEEPIRMLRCHLYAAEPGDAQAVADGCLRISLWAEGSRFPATALLFAHVAALAAPGEAGYAHRVAMLARTRAECARAEVWYRRAVTLGRRTGDWTSYARSLAGLGLLYRQKGNYPAAQRFTVRFLRATRKYRLHDLEGDALHKLCALAIEQGHRTDVIRYGRDAFKAYGPKHPDLPQLASDLAWYWMVSEGAFGRSLVLFWELLHHFQQPVRRLFALANLVRAAGGAGERTTYEWATEEVWKALRSVPDEEGHADALLDLAYGAMSLDLYPEAEHAARRALDVATRRREAKVILAVESILARLEQTPVLMADEETNGSEEAGAADEDALAADLLEALVSVHT